MAARDWFRSEVWNDEIAAEFEQRLARARLHNRAQYLRIQGVHLFRTGDPALRRIALSLFQRVLDDYPDADSETKSAVESMAGIHFADGRFTEAEEALRDLIRRVDASPTGTSHTSGTAWLQLAEVTIAAGGRARLADADRFLDAAEIEAAGHKDFRDIVYRYLLARARVTSVLRPGEAAEYATAALEVAAEQRSPFAFHPTTGLARTSEEQLRELNRIARPRGWRRWFGNRELRA